MKAEKPHCEQRVHAQRIAVVMGFLLAFTLGFTFRANAQISILKPLHIAHVQGVVTDRFGRPVASAEVALVREESIAFTAKTDDSGRFVLDHASGRYRLRVSGPSYSSAFREVIIGPDWKTIFHKTELYVMLGPGACSDECSWIYASKKKFDRAVSELRAEEVYRRSGIAPE